MSTLTKNQHYVWRNYLRAWTDSKGNIACLIQNEDRLLLTKPENIAVERFFYEVVELTAIELEWINSLIERASIPEVREMHRETVAIFQYAFKLQAWLNTRKNMPDASRKKIQEKIDQMRKMLGEQWHTAVENLAIPIFDALKLSDPSFYEENTGRSNFINYISQQFMRTPKMRKLQIREKHPFYDQGLDLDRTWFLESQIIATNVSTGILLEQHQYKFKFLQNDTNNKFITGDQPVISLGVDGIGFRLYYPLGPSLALIYEKDGDAPLKTITKVGSMQIDYYNNQIYKFSSNQIYGCEKDHLKSTAALPKDVLAE